MTNPPTPPYTEATVELLALALFEADRLPLADPPYEELAEFDRDSYRRVARLQLDALVKAGLLLPQGAETRYAAGVAAGRAQAAADIRATGIRDEDLPTGRGILLEREHAAKIAAGGADRGGVADHRNAFQDRVWWLHRCNPQDPVESWLSETPGERRPAQCPRCGGGSGWGWFEVRPVGGSTERDDLTGTDAGESALLVSTGVPVPRAETEDGGT